MLSAISKRILLLKGDMSYVELSCAITMKTGKRISPTGLFHLATGERKGKAGTLEILSAYADKPMAWFYTDDAELAEVREQYLVPTGNPHEDKRRKQLLDLFVKSGQTMTLDVLEQLVQLARKVAVNDAKYKKS